MKEMIAWRYEKDGGFKFTEFGLFSVPSFYGYYKTRKALKANSKGVINCGKPIKVRLTEEVI